MSGYRSPHEVVVVRHKFKWVKFKLFYLAPQVWKCEAFTCTSYLIKNWALVIRFCLSFSVSECEGFQTCEECQSNPACGWCDDGSNTGLGKCIEGGDDWPYTEDLDAIQEGGGRGVWIPDPEACPTPRWYFAECPRKCDGLLEHYSSQKKCPTDNLIKYFLFWDNIQ